MATLEQYKKAILFKNQDLSKVPMPLFISRLSAYMKNSSQVQVEEGAVLFYLLNQGFGYLISKFDKNEELPAEADALARMYLNTASESSARLFYYLFLITTRESRHCHSNEAFFNKIKTKFGEDMFNFTKGGYVKDSSSIMELFNGKAPKLLENTTLGTYIDAITEIFYKGAFGGGYGGKPWGDIADTLRKVVAGETSLEIMNDTAWTLAHNNGPMFNKGMLYNGYDSLIYKILDVQRSGQIPNLLEENGATKANTPHVKEAFALVKPFLPEDYTGYVDWFKVEALGSLRKYPSEKKAQTAKYGATNFVESNTKFWVNQNEYITQVTLKRAA